MTEVIELVNTDTKKMLTTIFCKSKKVEEILSILSRSGKPKKTQVNFVANPTLKGKLW